MKIAIVDDVRIRRNQIVEQLQKKRFQVVSCQASGDFMSAVDHGAIDKILLNVPTWKKGRSIYSYFRFAKKLESIPIVFYNAPDGYSISEREAHSKDRVIGESAKVDDIISVVDQGA